jgi:hypothetical protein
VNYHLLTLNLSKLNLPASCELLGLSSEDGPSEKASELIQGKNKRVEEAILYFRKHFGSRSDALKRQALDAYEKAWHSQRQILEYAYENKLFDKDTLIDAELSNNDVKILSEGNKIIKEGLPQKIHEQIEYYEKALDKNPITMSVEQKEALDQFDKKEDAGKFSFDRFKVSK